MTILQRLKERRRELLSDAKNKKLKEMLKGEPIKDHDMWTQFLLIGDHRIAELDYIIILLKEEGIIPKTKKDKLRKAEWEKETKPKHLKKRGIIKSK